MGTMRTRWLLFFVLLAGAGIVSAVAQQSEEYIIVSGGPALIEWEKYKETPHDKWWGNFIRSARVRMQELRKQRGADVSITWLVYRPGYVRRAQRQDGTDLIANIVSVRDKYNVKLVWFDRTDQLIGYLNAGKPRDAVKISGLEIYAHSNKACFMFDYSNEVDSGSKVWFHIDDIPRLAQGIFTKKPFIKSWGCHTGELFSGKWKKATGRRMIGAIGKTDYAHGYLNNWIPALAPKGRWGG